MNSLSPFQHRLNVITAKVVTALFPSKNIFREAYICYNEKLPKKVKVTWSREDDGFIVGNVEIDGYQFTTQGKDAKDFIEMVNDAIYAVYEIPPQYISKLGGHSRYLPKPHQLEELSDKSILKSSFGFDSDKKFAIA